MISYSWHKFGFSIVLFCIFTTVFYIMSRKGHHFNVGAMSLVDSVYFTTMSIGTFGIGDIYPISNTGKLCVSAMIMSIIWLILV